MRLLPPTDTTPYDRNKVKERQEPGERKALGEQKAPKTVKKPEGKTIKPKGQLGSISLKINGKKEDSGKKGDKETEPGLKSAKDSFTHEELLKAWTDIALSYKKESLALFMAMTGKKPELGKDLLLKISVDNAIQQDLINDKKPEILATLHKALNNHYIDIKAEINKNNKKQKAYLPAEKLQELINKNPDIKKLKDSLGLDIEY